MDICVRCGACADKCHFFIGSGDPKNMPVLRAELLRSIYRRDFTTAGKLLGKHRRRARADPGRAQGVVLLLLPVHRVPALLGLLPLRHRHRRDHDDGPRAAEPGRAATSTGCSSRPPTASAPATTSASSRTPSRTTSSSWSTTSRTSTGIRVDPPINHKGAEVLFVIPSADYFADPGIYTFMGYLLLFEQIGLDYTLQRLRLRGRQLRPLHLARDDEAAQRQDVRRGQAPGREVDPRRRVRPHVARAAPVHGHDERPGRLPRGAQSPDHRHASSRTPRSTKMVHICEFTADLIKHGKLKLDPQPQRPLAGHLPRLLQPGAGHGPVRGAALRPQQRRATTSTRCRRTPSASRPSAAAAGPASAPTRTWRCGCAAACRAANAVALRAREARREPARLHLRHRPATLPPLVRVLGRRGSRWRACTSWWATPWSWRARRSAPATCAASPLAADGRRQTAMHDEARSSPAWPSSLVVVDARRSGTTLRCRDAPARPELEAAGARRSSASLPRGVHARVRTWSCSTSGATTVVRDGERRTVSRRAAGPTT